MRRKSTLENGGCDLYSTLIFVVSIMLASFPGSSAPEREIELVHAVFSGIFSHVSTAKGRTKQR